MEEAGGSAWIRGRDWIRAVVAGVGGAARGAGLMWRCRTLRGRTRTNLGWASWRVTRGARTERRCWSC